MTEDDIYDHVEEINIIREIDVLDYLEGITYECSECNKRFDTKNGFTQHTNEGHRTTDSTDEKKVVRQVCPKCNIAFTRKNNLLRHLKKFHKDLVPPIRSFIYDELCTHKCPICENRFTRKSNLLRHIRRFHEFLIPSLYRQNPKLYSCPLCDTGFTKWSNCKRHIKHFHESLSVIHLSRPTVQHSKLNKKRDCNFKTQDMKIEFNDTDHEEIPQLLQCTTECVLLPCSCCDLVFTDLEELQKHAESIHEMNVQSDTLDEKVCPLCSFCDSKTNLIIHLNNAHNQPIIFQCLCFESSEQLDNWRVRMEEETSSKYIDVSKRKESISPDKRLYACSQSINKCGNQNIRYCPSEIEVLKTEDKYEVYFVGNHIGHDSEVKK